MEAKDKIPFAKLMGELSVSFNHPIEKETMAVFFNRLQDLTFYQVRLAIDQIIAYDERFPVFSRVRSLAILKKREPASEQDAPMLEEVVVPNGLPKTKEDFLAAMDELMNNVSTKKEEK